MSDPQTEVEIRRDAWSQGFHACWNLLASRLAQAEADRDRYYYEAYNSEESKRRHRELLRTFDVIQHRKDTDEWWAELERTGLSALEVDRV